MSLYSNSIFWVEVDKINPNPYQPRRDFEEGKLQDLADSIRQYGVLQPLVVSRTEKEKEDGGLYTEYELIAGERRLRASRIAGLKQVPVLIRQGDDSKTKLELAIIIRVVIGKSTPNSLNVWVRVGTTQIIISAPIDSMAAMTMAG